MSESFDATVPQYIEAAAGVDLTGVSNWALGAWVKSDDWSTTGDDQSVIARYDFGGGDGYQWYLQVRADGTVRGVLVDSFFQVLDSSSPISTNAWHLLIMRFGAHDAEGASNLDLWVDAGVVSTGMSLTALHGTSAPMRIGAGGSGGIENPFHGLISRPFVLVGATPSNADCVALASADPTGSTFWTIGAINELVDYGGFTTLTNHGATYSSDEPFSTGGGVAALPPRFRVSQSQHVRRVA